MGHIMDDLNDAQVELVVRMELLEQRVRRNEEAIIYLKRIVRENNKSELDADDIVGTGAGKRILSGTSIVKHKQRIQITDIDKGES